MSSLLKLSLTEYASDLEKRFHIVTRYKDRELLAHYAKQYDTRSPNVNG